MRHKHRVRQIIINYLLSFILMLSIVVIVIGGIGKYSFASERAVVHAGEKTHYYYNLKKEIEQNAIDIGIPYGIDKDCIKNVFQESKIKSDVIKTFSEAVENNKAVIDTWEIEKRIRDNVEKREGKLNSEQTDSLNSYIRKVQDLYLQKLHYPTEKVMVQLIKATNKLIWIVIPLAVVLGIFCAFYLIVSRHYAYHGIRYVVYGMMGAGALITVGSSAIISNGEVYNYNVTDSFLKEFYVYYVGHPLLMYVIFGIGVLVFALLGIFLVYRQKYAIRN